MTPPKYGRNGARPKHGPQPSCCYPYNKHTIPISILYRILPIYIGGGKPFIFLFRPAAGSLYLLPIRFWNEEKTLTTYSFGESLTSCCPCCPTWAVYQMNYDAKIAIFSLLQYFSLLFFYNNTQITIFVSYFLK